MERIKNMVIWSILASLGSVSVVVFSFLLPAYQEQTDRLRASEVIDSYEKVGRHFFRKQHYSEAEKVFTRAVEFSENKRLDLELMRLRSRIYKVYEQEDWKRMDFGEDLEAGDFLFLIETTENKKERAEYMGAYGIFLATTGKVRESVHTLHNAVDLDPQNVINLINLGNAYDDLGETTKAIATLEKALKLKPESFIILYNLASIHLANNDCGRARPYMDRALRVKDDPEARKKFRPCM